MSKWKFLFEYLYGVLSDINSDAKYLRYYSQVVYVSRVIKCICSFGTGMSNTLNSFK